MKGLQLIAWLLVFTTISCATKEKRECLDQDSAVVLEILKSVIDLQIEPLSEITNLTEQFRQKKIRQPEFESRLDSITEKVKKINSAGRVAIENFAADHPECKIEAINKYLKTK